MPCTHIDGTPGAAKTLYVVDKIIRGLPGSKAVWIKEDDTEEEVERHIYSNINRLRFDHVLLDCDPKTGTWDFDIQTQDWKFKGNELHIRNWHNWAKPGSVIVLDEYQKVWPVRPNGSRVPPDIQAFDTHRHMGVEFILISQDATQVDRHITGRVDRHLHVRKFGMFPVSTVYEWDKISRQLLFRNALAKHPYRWNKKAYALYRSASMHVKSKRSAPTALYFILVGLVGAAFFWYSLTHRLSDAASGKRQASTAQTTTHATTAMLPDNKTTVARSDKPNEPVFAGCVAKQDECACYDSAGTRTPQRLEYCLNGLKEPVDLKLDHLYSYVKVQPEPDDSMNFSPGIRNILAEKKIMPF
jgi:zona occludens toxin